MTITINETVKLELTAAKHADGLYAAVDNNRESDLTQSQQQGFAAMLADLELTWKFPEFPEEFIVKDIKTKTIQSVSFMWDKDTVVSILQEALADNSDVLKVAEDGKEYNEET